MAFIIYISFFSMQLEKCRVLESSFPLHYAVKNKGGMLFDANTQDIDMMELFSQAYIFSSKLCAVNVKKYRRCQNFHACQHDCQMKNICRANAIMLGEGCLAGQTPLLFTDSKTSKIGQY